MYRDALTRLYEPESAASPFVPLRDPSEAAPTGHEHRETTLGTPDASLGPLDPDRIVGDPAMRSKQSFSMCENGSLWIVDPLA